VVVVVVVVLLLVVVLGVVVVLCVLVVLVVEVLVVGVVGVVVVVVVVVWLWQSVVARSPTVLAPCLRLLASVELIDAGRFSTALRNPAAALAAASH
jgi:hypothetical protein